MNIIQATIALGTFLIAPLQTAIGATYFFSDCQGGAHINCIAGDNVNSGLSPQSPKRNLAGMKLSAGDSYKFSRGGVWSNMEVRVYIPGSTKKNPTIFTDYIPTWGMNASRPVFQASSDGVVFRFEDSGNSDQDEGYVVSNIEMRGMGNTGKGVFVFNDADHITIENVVIDGFSIGVFVGGSNQTNPGSDGKNSYFTLRNSQIKNNAAQGLLGAGPNMLIEQNIFDNNGFQQRIFDHNVYISGKGENIVVRGNTLTRNARVNGGPCDSVSLVSHGHHPNMIVENNFIYEDQATSACFGIDLNSSTGGNTPQDFSNLIIRGNRVVFSSPNGTTGQAIGCSSCPGAMIENNIIVIQSDASTSTTGIVVPSASRNSTRSDIFDGPATIRNNSIYINTRSNGSNGIRVGQSQNANESIVSNLIIFGPSAGPSVKCLNYSLRTAQTFASTGNNLCHRTGGTARWSDIHPTLEHAQASGYETGSQFVDPDLLEIPSASNMWAIIKRSTSPAINKGHPSMSSAQDITGRSRDSRPDIGAQEWTNVSKPKPPTDIQAR